jgi:sugar phosphate isomerase/epimerase
MPSRIDLIASYWTICGKTKLAGGLDLEGSPIEFPHRVEAARRVGYCGVGLQYTDLLKVVGRHGHTGIASILADNGMKYFEVEFLTDWFADGERRRQSDAVRRDLLLAAERTRARHIKIGGDMEGRAVPIDRMVETFATLCDEAANAGTKVVIEILPWSNIADLRTGLAVVAGANKSNGALLFDIWHVSRGNISYEDMASVPRKFIDYIEINDAAARPVDTLLEDTVMRRKLCGEGDLDVRRFLRCVKATGYDGPFGVEIISVEQRNRSLDEAAALSYSTALAQFADIYT